ncbi:MAG: hypothetical protein RLZZ09_1499 [Pseudomonadota bacterium]
MTTSKFLTLALYLILTSCAAFDADESETVEENLLAAGFQMTPAENPEQIQSIESLPQRALTPQEKDGKSLYVYADLENCQCAYWGDKSAYDRYQRLKDQASVELSPKDAASRIDPWAQGPWWVY